MYLRLLDVLSWLDSSFLSSGEYYSVVWVDHSLLIHLLKDFLVVSEVRLSGVKLPSTFACKICVDISFQLFRVNASSMIAGLYGEIVFSFGRKHRAVFQRGCALGRSLHSGWGFLMPRILASIGAAHALSFARSDRGAVVSGGCVNLHFPNDTVWSILSSFL